MENIDDRINVPRRWMKGLLLLFYRPYVSGTKGSEKTFNHDFTEMNVVLSGIPTKVYKN